MADINQRVYSKDYSGLANQTVIAVVLVAICTTSHEYMKRKRRGKSREEPLGSVESWQFGYLYQGRSWAKNPSPPTPRGWPLSWVKEVVMFPESRLLELRGMDATVYNRFLRGCFWFVLVQSFTTSFILLPIHIQFSDNTNARKSMNRALISSLVSTTKGKDLLWIHLFLMFWVTVSWVLTLVWITRGAFRYRAKAIERLVERSRQEVAENAEAQYEPHPHPQHPFHEMPPLEIENYNRGLKLRTIMVTNIPQRMRSEKELREYFEHYMSKPLLKPSLGITSGRQPGIVNKGVAYILNRLREKELFSHGREGSGLGEDIDDKAQEGIRPEIQRVLFARKMTELASRLDRREEMLKRLETAHIKLAKNVLEAVKKEMDLREFGPSRTARVMNGLPFGHKKTASDVEEESLQELSPEARMDLLVETLAPYVEEFEMRKHHASNRSGLFNKLSSSFKNRFVVEKDSTDKEKAAVGAPQGIATLNCTIWEALYNLPRSVLHPYQPLVHLSVLFRGKTVPAIDYYTTKVDLLSKLIAEHRSQSIEEYEPVSTAFVTFTHPDDARRAVNYLAVHPANPMVCLVTMAPDYEDIDWVRVMKSRFKAELLKDWVVNLGVWAFTIVWVIPVSLLVALVSISNISHVWPGLQNYLNNHAEVQDLLSSLLPTALTSGLMLLIPVLLLLIAKKAHTINTLSALHDLILTRYHKFLVANILVFFCVGVTALESFFTSFKNSLDVLNTIGNSFPSSGPFYVGWIIFTTGLHGGLELGLFGLPLIVYPATKRAVTPRRRAVGIRPRTFNYYYWLPNHVLIIIITATFAVLNPLQAPFTLIYLAIEHIVVRNQLIHVYAKNYEAQGSLILVRVIRYSLDGFILAQVIFLGFLAVEKKEIHVGLSAVLIAATIVTKLLFTRVVRVKLETADIYEARSVCGVEQRVASPLNETEEARTSQETEGTAKLVDEVIDDVKAKTWKLKKNFVFDYSALGQQNRVANTHKPNPFNDQAANLNRMHSWNGHVGEGEPSDAKDLQRPAAGTTQRSMPDLSIPPKPELVRDRTRRTNKCPLVTPHDKHPAWDDTSRLDRPYDNPYYARPVPNFLWLPRNPVGLLDLDDTVDLHKSLTTDPAHGEFGEIVEGGVGFADIPMVFTSSPNEQGGDEYPLPPQLTGDEEIALPPEIARRVENIHQEDEVEYADEQQRPSLLNMRKSSGGLSVPRRRGSTVSSNSSKPGLPLVRPTTFDDAALPRAGRIRSGSVVSNMSYARHSALLSRQEPIRKFRSATMLDQPMSSDAVSHRPSTAQSRLSLASGAALDVGGRARQASSLIRVADSGSSSQLAVTSRDAIVNEVIAEEVQASEIQQKEEETEKEKAAGPERRSWLTRWLFSRKHEHET